jgi:uncharacterized membrane protein
LKMRFACLVKRLSDARDGNIAIMAAICAPLILSCLALGVDYGAMTLQQRRLQQASDIAAIVAAADISNAASNLVANFQQNGINVAVKFKDKYAISGGPVGNDVDLARFDAIAEYTPGTYLADLGTEQTERFVPGRQPYDAVRVSLRQKANLIFGGAIVSAPTLTAVGTASSSKIVAFSVGSRLGSLNGGVLNSVLGALLGTSLSLKAVDYEALATADLNLLSYLDLLATRLDLTAVTYDQLLQTEVGLPAILGALQATKGVSSTAARATALIESKVAKTQIKMKLRELVDLGPLGTHLIGTGSNLAVQASLLDVISATAQAANHRKQIAIDLGGTIPGIANTTLNLAIGEPPKGVTSRAVGSQGAVVRTAQVRAALNVGVTGLSVLAGLKISVPIYVEIAYSEARLSSVKCLGRGPKNADVGIEVVPGVAEITLGQVDNSAFANFGKKPRVEEATIIDTAVLKAIAKAHAEVTNTSKTQVNFTASDIRDKLTKNVSTRDSLTSTVQSLLKNTDVDIELLFLKLMTDKAAAAALGDTLSSLTRPVDELLYNTLLMLGIKIGEADVRVTDARCQQSVLVQ